jgi:serine/threonine protein kinase/hemoglobin-like flavoprotein
MSKERNPVATFLHGIGLAQYAQTLLENGFDDMETLIEIEDEHMKQLGMPPGHVVKLKKRLRELNADRASSVDIPSSAQMDKMHTQVQKSWLVVQEIGIEKAGEVFYKKVFEIVPDAKKLFPMEVRNRYRDWAVDEVEDEDDLDNSPALRRLFAKIVQAIGSAVAGLQDLTRLVPLLTQLGARHVAYGLSEEHFKIGGEVLMLTLKETLGDLFTKEVENAWSMVYGFISANMISGFRAKLAENAAAASCRSQSSGSSQATAPLSVCPMQSNMSSVCPMQSNMSTVENTAPLCEDRHVSGGKEIYRIVRHVHKAIFGDVYETVGESSGRAFAMKVFDQEAVQQFERPQKQELDHLFCESPLCEVRFSEMMKGLDNVVHIEDHFEDELYHYVVSEFSSGGDLLEALRLQPGGFPEHQAQLFIRDAAKGLASLHARGLAMQDVSIENMLIHVHQDDSFEVRICDPGQAVTFAVDPLTSIEKPVQFHGRVAKAFRPPELYTEQDYLATKVDAWCLGWSTFYLLAGLQLFESTDPALKDPDYLLFSKREFSKLFERKGMESRLSSHAKDFIVKLLDPDTHQRMSVKCALWHPWLANVRIPSGERKMNPVQRQQSAAFAQYSPRVPAILGLPSTATPYSAKSISSENVEREAVDPLIQAKDPKLSASITRIQRDERRSNARVAGVQGSLPTLLHEVRDVSSSFKEAQGQPE